MNATIIHTAKASPEAYDILYAISCDVGFGEAQDLLADANAYWTSTESPDREDVLDAALLLVEAQRLRLAGNVYQAMQRENSLDRILRKYHV